jgi:hypothetical protein
VLWCGVRHDDDVTMEGDSDESENSCSNRAKIGNHIDARMAARSIRRPTSRSAKYTLQAIQQANSTARQFETIDEAVFDIEPRGISCTMRNDTK